MGSLQIYFPQILSGITNQLINIWSTNIGSWCPVRLLDHGECHGQQDQLKITKLFKRGVKTRLTLTAIWQLVKSVILITLLKKTEWSNIEIMPLCWSMLVLAGHQLCWCMLFVFFLAGQSSVKVIISHFGTVFVCFLAKLDEKIPLSCLTCGIEVELGKQLAQAQWKWICVSSPLKLSG